MVGGGVFGVCAALALVRRGAQVRLFDPGPLPHPAAASSDISKVVRLDYGADLFYLEAMERALAGWRALNEGWPRPLFHETGFCVLSSAPFAAGDFEADSYAALRARGHRLDRLDEQLLREHLAPLTSQRFVDGYYNPQGGWVESAAVIGQLAEQARREGVLVEQQGVRRLLLEGQRVTGVELADGGVRTAGTVVVAAGVWSGALVPELAELLSLVGQPVMMLAPAAAAAFAAPRMVPWAADIGRTGWYGFCANSDGVVKLANHGPGRALLPDAPRVFTPADETHFRAFLADTFAGLAQAPLADTRVCLYCDSFDGDFFIAPHPRLARLVVATGGSGHAFKFAPLIGDWVADAVQNIPNPDIDRFAWRTPHARRSEQARKARNS